MLDRYSAHMREATMSPGTTSKRFGVRAAGAVLGLSLVSPLVLVGCTPDNDDNQATASVTPQQTVSVSMAVWSGFGLEELVAEYEAENPGVTIALETGSYNDLHAELSQELAAGAGAPTIAAIGEDYIARFVAQPEPFVNLGSFGAEDLEPEYLAWKWQQGLGPSGEVLALGGDVAGLALCYRPDLLEAAGLPAERDAVSAQIGDSWQGLIDFALAYREATGKPLLDSASAILPVVRQQLGYTYVAADGTIDVAPAEGAFADAMTLVGSGLSAGLVPYSEEWTAELDTDAFAATLCPVWGMGYIESQVTESGSKARWDIADVPGPGGSWGGTFYAITSQASPQQREAAWDFLAWLQEPEQQIALFRATGSLPSQAALLEDGSVTAYTNAFFNDAPVGPLLAAAVTELEPADGVSEKDASIEDVLEAVVAEVQIGNAAPADGWAIALEAVKQANP